MSSPARWRASASFVEEVNRLMRLWGQAIDPHAAWLIDRGMRTLASRMERHNANGMAVAQWAEQHAGYLQGALPRTARPIPTTRTPSTVLAGFGGMVGLELKGGARATERMLKRLKLITHAPSLAGVETLVSEPRLTSHKGIGAEGRSQDRHPGRLPSSELRHRGRGGHHRRPGAGAEE